MYVPKKGSLRDRICMYFMKHGALCMDDVAAAFKGERYNTVTSAVFQLKFNGAMNETDGVYTLTNNIRRHYGDDIPEDPQPEPRVVVSTFKAWTDKYNPANALRREPLRDGYSYISSGSSINPWRVVM